MGKANRSYDNNLLIKKSPVIQGFFYFIKSQ